MSDTANTSLGQFKRVPLSQIRPSRKNPRKIIRQEMIDARSASMAESGQDNPIIVRPLAPEYLANDGVIYEIVDGELRYRAALKNENAEINVQIRDISPLLAFKTAISSNRQYKPGWYEDYLAMEELENSGTMQKQEIAALFEVDNKIVTRALKITGALNEGSRALLLENFQKPSGSRQIAENTLLTLADLGDSQAVEGVLRVALDQEMTEPKAKRLVAWVKAGNPPETYIDHKAPASKTPKADKAKTPPPIPAETLTKATELGKLAGAEEARGDTATTHRDALKAFMDNAMAEAPTPYSKHTSALPTKSGQTTNGQMDTAETLAWDAVLGISLLSRIKAKVKKGERPTFGEALLLAGDKLVHLLIHLTRWMAKHGIKGVFRVIKWVWRALMEALKELGLYKPLRSLLLLVLVVLMLVTAWDIHERGWMHPVQFLIAHLLPAKTEPKVPTAEPTPPAVNSSAIPDQKPRPVAIASSAEIKTILPMQAYVESQSSVEDQKYLEMEIATLPHYSRVKDFPFTPLPMNADMASRRLADIQDSDKYKVFWGSDQQSVISITPTASNCTLMFKGGLEGLLGSTGKMEIYWEDVKCIHCSEIAAGLGKDAHTYFQFSLVVPAIKKPLTVQCDSAVELGHLISSLEFWLKTSRGTTAPLVGFPYLNQGLWLKGDNEVGALWANSPADKAGLQLGDFFWSVGKNTLDPQHHAAFEKALQSPQNTFFVVSPVDWKKAQAPPINAPSNYFNPKRRKVTLTP